MINKAKEYCKNKVNTTAAKLTGGGVGVITLLGLMFTFVNNETGQLSAKIKEKETILFQHVKEYNNLMYKYVNSKHEDVKDNMRDIKNTLNKNNEEIRATRRDIRGIRRLILDFHTTKGN